MLRPARVGSSRTAEETICGKIAAVAYSGLLGGPVAIGAAASGVGLRDALLIPAALSVLVAVAAGVLSPHQASPGRARLASSVSRSPDAETSVLPRTGVPGTGWLWVRGRWTGIVCQKRVLAELTTHDNGRAQDVAL